MLPLRAESADHIFARSMFDSEWYSENFPDVRMSGLTPEYHFRSYGFPALFRPPNGAAARDPLLHEAFGLSPPKTGEELATAYEILLSGRADLAIKYASVHLPETLSYTNEIMRANAALGSGDQDSWLVGLNNYLKHFGMDPLILLAGNTPPITRLSTDNFRPVEGGPLVSIIMPAWNAETWISMAVWSILNQTWRNLELIVIDDASTDNTWEVLKNLGKGETRLHLRRNSINVGPYVSKNIGLTMANGDWVTGHDADDWAHPRRIERHMSAVLAELQPPEASVTFMIRMQQSGHFDTIVPVNPFSPDGVTRVSSISALFSRKLLRDHLGYWDTVRFGADSEMIARARRFLGKDIVELKQIGMICLSTETTLTNHPEFGIRANSGRPAADRVSYKKSWTQAHKTAQIGDLFLSFPQSIRKYQGEFSHAVALEDLQKVCAENHFLS